MIRRSGIFQIISDTLSEVRRTDPRYMSNSPREVQTESEWQGKGLIQETRARIKTLENTQGKARL